MLDEAGSPWQDSAARKSKWTVSTEVNQVCLCRGFHQKRADSRARPSQSNTRSEMLNDAQEHRRPRPSLVAYISVGKNTKRTTKNGHDTTTVWDLRCDFARKLSADIDRTESPIKTPFNFQHPYRFLLRAHVSAEESADKTVWCARVRYILRSALQRLQIRCSNSMSCFVDVTCFGTRIE